MADIYLGTCKACGQDITIRPPSGAIHKFNHTCEHCGKKSTFTFSELELIDSSQIDEDAKNGETGDEAPATRIEDTGGGADIDTLDNWSPQTQKVKRLSPKSLKPIIAGCVLAIIFFAGMGMAFFTPQDSLNFVFSTAGNTTYKGRLLQETTGNPIGFTTNVTVSEAWYGKESRNIKTKQEGLFSITIPHGLYEGTIVGKDGYLDKKVTFFSLPFLNHPDYTVQMKKEINVFAVNDNIAGPDSCAISFNAGPLNNIAGIQFSAKHANFSVWLQQPGEKTCKYCLKINCESQKNGNWTEINVSHDCSGKLHNISKIIDNRSHTLVFNHSVTLAALQNDANFSSLEVVIGFWGDKADSRIKDVQKNGTYIKTFKGLETSSTTLSPSGNMNSILRKGYDNIDLYTYPMVFFAFIALLGAIVSFRRQMYGLAQAGAITGILSIGFIIGSVLGIAALVLLALSKNEFD